LTYEDLLELVGRGHYEAACWAARRDEWPKNVEMVPHDLQDLWFDDGAPLGERLDLALRVLPEMPCYANTMALKWHVRELDPHDRERLWSAYRSALDGDDERLADTVSYSLWVDFFEDQTTVAEAWRELIRDARDTRVRRVLSISGPVPWSLKAPWFGWLGKRWHGEIAQAVRSARAEYFGQLDEREARRWLDED
jgi:hypothetical protein